MSSICHVYIIGARSIRRPFNLVKVGIATAPHSRVRDLQTANPFELFVHQTYRFPDRNMALKVEASFHEMNAGFRTSGEWFAMTPAEAHVEMCRTVRAFLGQEVYNTPELSGKAAHRWAYEFVMGLAA